jgi:AcrR family transcriptional regulator
MQGDAAEVIGLPLLAEQLPGPPPASLDPLLDAAVECLSRHGLSRTSVADIARELGVAPSTVYRKVGSVENAANLVMARQNHRLVQRIPEIIAGVEGPRIITVFLAAAIRETAEHPMVAKILRDEVDWMGRLATRQLQDQLQRAAEATAPLLEGAMTSGAIRTQDALALAHWIVRISFLCTVAPPPGDLLEELDRLLLPVLDPGT